MTEIAQNNPTTALVPITVPPRITSFLLVQGIDPKKSRGGVGGRFLSVMARPDKLDFSGLNTHEPWAVYAAGILYTGKRTIFYPVVITQLLPATVTYNFYVNFNDEEQDFKVTFKTIVGAVKFYLGQMFTSGAFAEANTTARIRIKPFIPRIGFDLPVGTA